MTKVIQMEGYEIHHPKSTLRSKVARTGGLPLKEIEKRMAEKMTELSEQFLAGIPAVIKAIDSALSKFERGEGGKPEQDILFRQGHDLKGMGGSFGFPIMSTIGEGICELTSNDIEPSAISLPFVRIHLDLLTYVAAKRIRDDTDPAAAPILTALADAKLK